MENNVFEIPFGTDLNTIFFESKDKALHQEREKSIMNNPNSEIRANVKSPLQIAIENNKFLQAILLKINPIDFEQKVHGDDAEFQELRFALETATTAKDRQRIKKDLKYFDVKIAEKLVVVAEEVSFYAEEIGTPCVVFENRFYIFNTQFWTEITPDIVCEFLVMSSIRCGIPKYTITQRRNRDDMYRQFIETQLLSSKDDRQDNEIKVNLKNGTLCVRNGKGIISAFNKDDFFRYQLSFKYDPTATCPLFDKFLDRVLPDKKCQDILFEMIGYCLTSHKVLNLEKALLIYGGGSNGKSVLWNVVMELLGHENVSSYSLQTICTKENARAQLSGKLLNYSTELGGKLEPDMWKKLVSGEPVEARYLFKDIFLISGYGKFFFNTNTLPKEVEQNDAFFRRLIILPFNEKISESEKDIQLFDKLKLECSGIFNRTLEALERLYSNKRFTQSEIVDAELESYRKTSNNVELFLDDELWIKSQKNKTLLKIMYQHYDEYCGENGFRALNRRNFSARLRDLGYEVVPAAQNFSVVFCEKNIPASIKLRDQFKKF